MRFGAASAPRFIDPRWGGVKTEPCVGGGASHRPLIKGIGRDQGGPTDLAREGRQGAEDLKPGHSAHVVGKENKKDEGDPRSREQPVTGIVRTEKSMISFRNKRKKITIRGRGPREKGMAARDWFEKVKINHHNEGTRRRGGEIN